MKLATPNRNFRSRSHAAEPAWSFHPPADGLAHAAMDDALAHLIALLSSPLLVCEGDSDDNRVLHASDAALALLGRDRHDIFDCYTLQAVLADGATDAPIASVLNGGIEPEATEQVLQTKDGSAVWCVCVRCPCPWSDDPGSVSAIFLLHAGPSPPSRRHGQHAQRAARHAALLEHCLAECRRAMGLALTMGRVGGGLVVNAMSPGADESPQLRHLNPDCADSSAAPGRGVPAALEAACHAAWRRNASQVCSIELPADRRGEAPHACVQAVWPLVCSERHAQVDVLLCAVVDTDRLVPTLGDYVVGEEIGAGAVATVRRGRRRGCAGLAESCGDVALKVARLRAIPARLVQTVEKEAAALRRLRHDGIVRLLGVLGDGSTHLTLVLELAPGRTLAAHLATSADGRLAPRDAWECGVQLCDALAYAHGRGVAHRDVKLENVVYDERRRRALLLDFNLAAACVGDEPGAPDGAPLSGQQAARVAEAVTEVVGTALYLPPEVSSDDARAAVDWRKADAFATGVLLLQLLTGRIAKPAVCDGALLAACSDEIAARYASLLAPHPEWGAPWAEAVGRMLDAEPERRCTPREAIAQLSECRGRPGADEESRGARSRCAVAGGGHGRDAAGSGVAGARAEGDADVHAFDYACFTFSPES